MAVTHTSTSAPLGASLIERITSVFTRIGEARARHAVYVATRNELVALTDRELNDIGINRSDITRIAMEASK